MSVFVQYAPYTIEGGWDDRKREAFGDAVIDTLACFAPNIRNAILHRQVITPADIERVTRLSEGNIFQGELGLHQLFFFRPAPAWAGYRTPVKCFYQCGAGVQRPAGVDDDRQLLVLDVDELQRVAGGVAVLGDDEGDL